MNAYLYVNSSRREFEKDEQNRFKKVINGFWKCFHVSVIMVQLISFQALLSLLIITGYKYNLFTYGKSNKFFSMLRN